MRAKAPRRVLIVDDDAVNRKLLRATLEAEGIGALEGNDGAEALAILERNPVDAVISDVLMPNMDGYQLCRHLRRSDRFQSMPFVVCTGNYTAQGDRELADAVGVDQYLIKPLSSGELLRALRLAMAPTERAGCDAIDVGEELVMQRYTNALVRKLEGKNLELEQSRRELEQLNYTLDQKVRERTLELSAVNAELDSFCHSVSHDLRAHLFAISGFAAVLREDGSERLSEKGDASLKRIIDSVERMRGVIDDLLELSRVSRAPVVRQSVDVCKLVQGIVASLRELEPDRQVCLEMSQNIVLNADPGLLLIALENVIRNAWKFTAKEARARIEVATTDDPFDGVVVFVRDNGAGFDMSLAGRLFTPFQRLHDDKDFPGIGVGLATARRIVARHGGRIWAEAEPGKGATFFFSLAPLDERFERGFPVAGRAPRASEA